MYQSPTLTIVPLKGLGPVQSPSLTIVPLKGLGPVQSPTLTIVPLKGLGPVQSPTLTIVPLKGLGPVLLYHCCDDKDPPFIQVHKWSINPLQYRKHCPLTRGFFWDWRRILTTSSGVTEKKRFVNIVRLSIVCFHVSV